MSKYEFKLILETKRELTPEELAKYLQFTATRIEGYYQSAPSFLEGANANLEAVGEAAKSIESLNILWALH